MPIVQELSVDRIPLGLCCRVQALVLKGAVRVNRKGTSRRAVVHSWWHVNILVIGA